MWNGYSAMKFSNKILIDTKNQSFMGKNNILYSSNQTIVLLDKQINKYPGTK